MSDGPRPAALRVIRNHVVIAERTLDAALSIGRQPGNDLVLDDERVSAHHGRLEPLPAGAHDAPRAAAWRYTDLGSTNGTTIAGLPVLHAGESALLTEDTQLLLGDTVLDLRLGDAEAAAAPAPSVAPRIERPLLPAPRDEAAPASGARIDAAPRLARRAEAASGAGPPPDTGAAGTAGAAGKSVGATTAHAAGPEPPGRPRLIVSVGGRAYGVPIVGRRAVIGRGAGCEVRIDDSSVSALQARLDYGDGGWTLTDLSATNPTRLGLRRVVGTEPIVDGDHLIAGAADLLFLVDDALAPDSERARKDERALELAYRDRRLSATQVRSARAALSAGEGRLGEVLVTRGWLSPGAWIELLTEAEAPVTSRDVLAAKRRRRIAVALLVVAAVALAAWLAVAAFT